MLDSFLEDESLFGEFLRAPVSEGGVEPLVVGPPHVVVEVAPRLLDRDVAVPVHELLFQRPVRRLDHGVVVGVALARQRSFDVEHVEQLVNPRVVELAVPAGVEHLDVRQREVERAERTQHQARVPGPPDGMAGDAPVRQADHQTYIRRATRRTRVRGVAVGSAVRQVREPGLVGRVPCGLNRLRVYAPVMPCSCMMLPMRLPDAVTPLLSRAVLIEYLLVLRPSLLRIKAIVWLSPRK